MEQFIGKTIKFNAQPYNRGTAKILDIKPSCGTWVGYYVVDIETVDAIEVSRLFQHKSERPWNGRTLRIYHYTAEQIRKAVEEGDTLIYVYPV